MPKTVVGSLQRDITQSEKLFKSLLSELSSREISLVEQSLRELKKIQKILQSANNRRNERDRREGAELAASGADLSRDQIGETDLLY